MIDPRLDIVWDIISEEVSEDHQWYTITATLYCDDERHSFIQDKYANYLSARGIE